jgi:hypothetical protein
MIPLNYDSPIEKYLNTGERLLWVGRPPQGIMFRRSDWVAIPFSLMWGGFAICWECAASGVFNRGRFNPCPATFGLPFVAIGLYMIIGRFFHDAWQRERTWYALTDRRALILLVGQTVSLKGVPLVEMPVVRLQQFPDGRGTIAFAPEPLQPTFNRGSITDFGRPTDPCFEYIESPREVYEMIRTAKEQVTGASAPAKLDPSPRPAPRR